MEIMMMGAAVITLGVAFYLGSFFIGIAAVIVWCMASEIGG
jgi:hypothetical protein